MEEYARIAMDEIERQWSKGINPAIYNGYEWINPRASRFLSFIRRILSKKQ